MQTFQSDAIGTHLSITVQTNSSCQEEFLEIESLCKNFEQNYSRFVPQSLLSVINEK